MIRRCTFCGLEADDLRVVSLAIVQLDKSLIPAGGKTYDWLPRCRDRAACLKRQEAAETANDEVLLA
jgi:hypothetical protein